MAIQPVSSLPHMLGIPSGLVRPTKLLKRCNYYTSTQLRGNAASPPLTGHPARTLPHLASFHFTKYWVWHSAYNKIMGRSPLSLYICSPGASGVFFLSEARQLMVQLAREGRKLLSWSLHAEVRCPAPVAGLIHASRAATVLQSAP